MLIYFVVYLLALLPGLPLGFALFGRRHAAGWIAGALFGYVVTSLAIWTAVFARMPSALVFAGAWAAAIVVVWLLTPGVVRPLIELPQWSARDSAALAAVWILTLAIAVPPFLRAGEVDAAGNSRYRAYFTADFVWHTALAAEIAKFDSPPRNPYLAHRPIHYYWTYFLLPSAVAGTAPASLPSLRDEQTCLKGNAIATALLFVSAIFICAWTALPYAWPVATGVTLAIVAASAEGTFALWRFWQTGVPLSEVRNLNIDAIANWWFHGVRTDGLQRCFWWVPQHSMAYALGLVALAVVNVAGSATPVRAIALAGLALGGATMMNPLVGGVFALVWGAAVAADAVRSGAFVPRILRHAVAVIPVAGALGWVMLNRMAEGGGSALQFGWLGDARNAPVVTLALSLGPALLAAVVGLAVGRVGRPFAPALLAALALAMMFFARLNVDSAWISFRSGQLFLIAVPALIARGFVTTGAARRTAVAAAIAAAVIGTPTTAIDAYNAQDTSNVSDGPIGPWTVLISPDQRAGLDWLRRGTPQTAIVQMEPLVRDRSTWSLIPSFAERRMAAGRPISLLGGTSDYSEYAERAARVRAMYQTGDARQAWNIARALRIDYVWVDGTERSAYPSGVAKFDGNPALFAPVFTRGDVRIYRVHER
ncbi:MAG TPA: hypothetical protein VFK57_07525 [Vicinamibacterales bacterium]|nr:hypothetical protein [Vicinamibacterales bacterium]